MLGMTGTALSLARTGMSPDEIERRIIRAYIHLAWSPETAGSRTFTVLRFGMLEAWLTGIQEAHRLPDPPGVRLDLYSHARHAVVDSCECAELDAAELAQAVTLIARAWQRVHNLH
jgi:hypothetical protein